MILMVDPAMSLITIIKILVGFYLVVAVLAFIINVNIGPLTLGLCLLRVALWPLWLAGMIPGERLSMD